MSFAKIGVVGSGIMGSGVAEAAAGTGAQVIVRSRSIASADAVLVADRPVARQAGRKGQARRRGGGRRYAGAFG